MPVSPDDLPRTGDLLGMQLDAEWLRHRIWEGVEVSPAVEERVARGARLLVVLVAEARTPVEDGDGRMRWRVETHYVDVDRSEWWLQQRALRAQDPLAAPSERTLAEVQPSALGAMNRLLAERDPLLDAAPAREQLTRIGASRPDDRLSRAAALLLCPSRNPLLAVTVVDVEGGDVVVAPPRLTGLSLLEQLLAVEERLDGVNLATTVRYGLVEASDRSLPPAAVREALCNAVGHRDPTRRWSRSRCSGSRPTPRSRCVALAASLAASRPPTR